MGFEYEDRIFKKNKKGFKPMAVIQK